MINTLALNSLSRVSSTIQSIYQLRLNKIHKFKPKIEIHCEVGPYILKTVSTVDEMKAALQLRYEVFHLEMIGKKQRGIGVDVDEFDFLCDHLIIVNKKTNSIIGTYRLNTTVFSETFYSSREFNLKRILHQPGAKMELGRACIHKDFRNGFTISLLWKGIAEYMTASNSQILFGCASIKTKNPREAALLYRYFFEEGRMTPEYFAPPTPAFAMPDLDLWIRYVKGPLTEDEKKEVKALIPPLFRAYLKIGAYVGGEPAWDDEFQCIDFLTILHREDINRTLWKRYKLDSGASFES
ncbi:MAG: GNAT family N-acetyltransferase [Bdellovibrionaceae bacterium]|nr:GNAT family N-acetyltransferase [Pseudobdellovibrionaceae bacterium]MBX3034523.1 GNAT family N-acetyltransferase [Pseudobdellovibrionaceae bacterium]